MFAIYCRQREIGSVAYRQKQCMIYIKNTIQNRTTQHKTSHINSELLTELSQSRSSSHV